MKNSLREMNLVVKVSFLSGKCNAIFSLISLRLDSSPKFDIFIKIFSCLFPVGLLLHITLWQHNHKSHKTLV